jgi:hypothetical protein
VALSDDAVRLAIERNVPADDFNAEFLYQISGFMEDWLASLYEWNKFDPRLWWHRTDPISDAKASAGPDFNKAEVEIVGGTYLALPCRSKLVERTLLDCLVAMEFYGFARELFDSNFIGRIGFIKGMGPKGFLFWRMISVLIFFVLLIPFIALANFDVISTDTAAIVGAGLACLLLLESLWALIWFPSGWHRQRTHNKKLGQLLSAITNVYRELESSGPFSAAYFRERLVKTSDEGVAWPSPVYAILDDILKRDGRF